MAPLYGRRETIAPLPLNPLARLGQVRERGGLRDGTLRSRAGQLARPCLSEDQLQNIEGSFRLSEEIAHQGFATATPTFAPNRWEIPCSHQIPRQKETCLTVSHMCKAMAMLAGIQICQQLSIVAISRLHSHRSNRCLSMASKFDKVLPKLLCYPSCFALPKAATRSKRASKLIHRFCNGCSAVWVVRASLWIASVRWRQRKIPAGRRCTERSLHQNYTRPYLGN